MRFSYLFLSILGLVYSDDKTCKDIIKQNNCVSFTVSQGTGCSWMCEYCQNELGTTNYYFTDGVCNYECKNGYEMRDANKLTGKKQMNITLLQR